MTSTAESAVNIPEDLASLIAAYMGSVVKHPEALQSLIVAYLCVEDDLWCESVLRGRPMPEFVASLLEESVSLEDLGPFVMPEVLPDNEVLHVGGITIDLPRHRCLIDGQQVELRPKLFATLTALVRGAGMVVTYDQLAQAIWARPADHRRRRCVSVYTCQLRKVLGAMGRINFVAEVGYRLET